jgi:hypothetical protein
LHLAIIKVILALSNKLYKKRKGILRMNKEKGSGGCGLIICIALGVFLGGILLSLL